MMESLRYIFGLLLVIAIPVGLLYWFVIHPWAVEWRRLGLVRTYSIVLPLVGALGAYLFHMRRTLMGADLGTNWLLIAVALLFSVPMVWLESQYWKQLSLVTLLGVPELSQQPGRLLREGIYARVRHPRYLSIGLGMSSQMLIANYRGVYILAALGVAPTMFMIWIEERELIQRFGDAYLAYQKQVPAVIPRWRKTV